jgi:benzoyl-CoA reductase/2-hydroxyglutaryl-CoA dehydratase subunit BcrC/BadD/HgdB
LRAGLPPGMIPRKGNPDIMTARAHPAAAHALPASIQWFKDMVPHNLAYAKEQKAAGKKLVGIACEYVPRELILAAGAMPVCLCGGFEQMIPPAERVLPANLCPLVKSTFGFHLEKANPFLELADLIVAETTCDGKKKMFELMAESRPVHLLELPQKPDEPDAPERWTAEFLKLRRVLEHRFGVRVTEERLREETRRMNRERQRRRDLAALMKADEPPLTGRELLDMKSLIACIPADLEQYELALKELPGRRLNPPAAERVRVLLTGVPLPHGAERMMDLIEGHGGLVVCQENCTGLKPILDDADPDAPDIFHALAEKYLHLPCSVMTPNTQRMESLRRLTAEYRPQCVIELVWQACLTYDVEACRVRRLVTEELGLPYLRIETGYSPSDSARIAVRVQALFETVRHRSSRGIA